MVLALLGLALLSLSSSPIWVRLASAPNAAIGAHRLLGAATILLVWQALQKKSPLPLLRPQHRQNLKWTLIAGFFFFLHLWTFTESAQNTSVAHLVMIYSAHPVFTALGALLFFREKLEKRLLISYPLAILGLFLMFIDQPRQTAVSFSGDVWALVSAALHSGYALASKHVRQKLDNVIFSFWMYVIAGLCFLVLLIWNGEVFAAHPLSFYGSILGLIVFPSLLGHTLFTYLLQHMNINVLSCAKLAEPSIAAMLAFFIFGENVGALAIIAFLLIASAVILLFLPRTAKVVRDIEA